jgi:hypothetical protein
MAVYTREHGVFKIGMGTELGWTTTLEHLSRINSPVTMTRRTVMTTSDIRSQKRRIEPEGA